MLSRANPLTSAIPRQFRRLSSLPLALLGAWIGVHFPLMLTASWSTAVALPPPDDVPEEIARTEIILEARSPIDGEPLTAAEYAELLAEIEQRDYPPELDPEIQQLIFLLRLRKLIRTFTPFM